jgi:hypothetical protein
MKPTRAPALRIGRLALLLLGALGWAGCADTIGPRWVQTVDVGPDSLHLEPGESGDLRVFRVLDQNGDELPEEWFSDVVWTNVTPWLTAVEPLGNGVSVTALETGIGAVRAKLGRDESQASIYIHPPGLHGIEIDPSPFTLSTLGGRVLANARLYDASGAEMSTRGFRLSWETADTTVAYISNFAYEFAIVWGRRVGQTRLRLIVGDTTVSADVFVVSEPVPPAAPDVFMLSSNSLEVIWNRVLQANGGYRVFRSTSAAGTYSHIASTGSATFFASMDTTYVDSGLSPGTTYFFQIEACHVTEGCSARSSSGSGTTASGGCP